MVWSPNLSKIAELNGRSTHNVIYYKPGILYEPDSHVLWNYETNTVESTKSHGFFCQNSIRIGDRVFDCIQDTLYDIESQRTIVHGNQIQSFWSESIKEVEPGVVAWPGDGCVVLFEMKTEKVLEVLPLEEIEIVRAYLFE
jgi:hypothetical protein